MKHTYKVSKIMVLDMGPECNVCDELIRDSTLVIDDDDIFLAPEEFDHDVNWRVGGSALKEDY